MKLKLFKLISRRKKKIRSLNDAITDFFSLYYIMSDITRPSALVNDLGKPLPGADYIITKRPHGP